MIAMYYTMRREYAAANEIIEEGLELTKEYGFASRKVMGRVTGDRCGGAGKSRRIDHGGGVRRFFRCRIRAGAYVGAMAIAEAMGNLGQTDIGFGLLSEAREVMERNDERYVESEIDRIRGELKLKQVSGPSSNEADVRAGEAEAEQSFLKAIEIARRRGAKSLELRAAISLSRMYLSSGRDTDAREILRPIHDWFTEGFNCIELKAARDVLKDIDSASKSPPIPNVSLLRSRARPTRSLAAA